MLCECGLREATIHEVTITNGVRVERHLCEQCAQKLGLPLHQQAPVSEILAKFVSKQGAQSVVGPRKPTAAQCPQCGLTFAAFKGTELLGCPTCYEAFEVPLSPLLERTHEGGTHHVGKVPKRALEASRLRGPEAMEKLLGGLAERQARIGSLRKQMEDAVKGEQYERAAQIRDEIRRVSSIAPSEPRAEREPPPENPEPGGPNPHSQEPPRS
ncbi:MAG: hypothetical protein EA378_00415 [Phycisphaerales bacterium]|nr:MAG: hypothetical protein EA378_00415 [Phycisphaerales bacterium]